MKNYELNYLLKNEKELNQICRNKGFEFNVVKKNRNKGFLVIKKLDNKTPSTIKLKIESSYSEMNRLFGGFITIYNLEGNIICKDLMLHYIPQFIYNFLNYEKVKIEYSFLGGKYDKEIMSKQQFEQTFNTYIKNNDLSSPQMFNILNFPLTLEDYCIMPFPQMDFGKLVFEYRHIEYYSSEDIKN